MMIITESVITWVKIQSTLIFVTATSYLKTYISLPSVDSDWEAQGGGGATHVM